MLEEARLHIVLYEPEIPQNTGNIGRTCVAVGAKLWLVQPLGFRINEKNLRRAGMDYWEHLDWQLVDDWPALTQQLNVEGSWLFTKHAAQSHFDAAYTRGCVLVFGSESRGLPKSLTGPREDRCLRIPMRPDARSLNLANSVAIAAYEAVRQSGANF